MSNSTNGSINKKDDIYNKNVENTDNIKIKPLHFEGIKSHGFIEHNNHEHRHNNNHNHGHNNNHNHQNSRFNQKDKNCIECWLNENNNTNLNNFKIIEQNLINNTAFQFSYDANNSKNSNLLLSGNLNLDGILNVNDDLIVSNVLKVDNNNKNVGILVDEPNYPLEVNGNVNLLQGNSYLINSEKVIDYQSLGDKIKISSLTTVGDLDYLNVDGDLTVKEILTVNTETNSIGILNQTPLHALDVNGDVNIKEDSNYLINGYKVLGKDTLGSGVINSYLKNVGTLENLHVSGYITAGQYNINNKTILSPNSLGADIKFSSLTSVGKLNNLDVSGTLKVDNSISTDTQYEIKGINVLNDSTLGHTVKNSSLTKVGILNHLDVNGFVNSNTGYNINGTNVLTQNSLGDNVFYSSLKSVGKLYNLDVSGSIMTNSNIMIDGKTALNKNSLGEDIKKSYLTEVGKLTKLTVDGVIRSNIGFNLNGDNIIINDTIGETIKYSSLKTVGKLLNLNVESDINADEVNTKKINIEETINVKNVCINFVETSDEYYTIADNYNIKFVNNTKIVYLPENLKDGSIVHLNNCSDNNISISSKDKIFHYILTPPEGLNNLILNQNAMFKFIYTNSQINQRSKWNIVG